MDLGVVIGGRLLKGVLRGCSLLLELLWVLGILLLLQMMLHCSLLVKSMSLGTKMGNLLRRQRMAIAKLLIEVRRVLLIQSMGSMCRHASILWCYLGYSIFPIHHCRLGHLWCLSYHANKGTSIACSVGRSNLPPCRCGMSHSWSALRHLRCAIPTWPLSTGPPSHCNAWVAMLLHT